MNRKTISGMMSISLLLSMLTLAFNIMLVEATSTVIYVDPEISMALPGDTFIVDINIADVRDLYAWQFLLRWEGSLLEVIDVWEGDFLSHGGVRWTWFFKLMYNGPVPGGHDGDYVFVMCTLHGDELGEFGSGTLARVTFRVEATGESTLHLYETVLLDSYYPLHPPMEHTVEDGYMCSLII